MHCGLGILSLRLLWGAVRNWQLYILRMYCKGCISFNFSFFLIIYTTYCKKKNNYTSLPQKKTIFFAMIYTIYRKKIYRLRRFFCARLTFFTARLRHVIQRGTRFLSLTALYCL